MAIANLKVQAGSSVKFLILVTARFLSQPNSNGTPCKVITRSVIARNKADHSVRSEFADLLLFKMVT